MLVLTTLTTLADAPASPVEMAASPAVELAALLPVEATERTVLVTVAVLVLLTSSEVPPCEQEENEQLSAEAPEGVEVKYERSRLRKSYPPAENAFKNESRPVEFTMFALMTLMTLAEESAPPVDTLALPPLETATFC